MTLSTANKILVAVDQSEQAAQAVRYMSGLLSPQDTQVVLLHVLGGSIEDFAELKGAARYMPDIKETLSAWQRRERAAAEDFMAQRRQVFLEAGFPPEAVLVQIREKEVGLARDLMDESKKDYSAVVVGRVGTSKLKDLVLGSISTKLVTKLSHVPVWVVGGSPLPGRVLLTLDGSEWSLRCAEHTARILGDTEARVTLFHVLRSPGRGGEAQNGFLDPAAESKLEQTAKAQMAEVFSQVRACLMEAGVAQDRISEGFSLNAASRAEAIVREARQGGYGTVVVGRRGISQVEEFFMGRVSNKVVSLAREMAVWVVN